MIRILATSDVHGYLFPYSYADNSYQNIGLAKVKTLIDSLRNENTVVIDNGDMLEGSPLAFYHYHYHQDEVSPMTKAMNRVGFDLINLGNHDFNYGMKALNTHLEKS